MDDDDWIVNARGRGDTGQYLFAARGASILAITVLFVIGVAIQGG